MLERIKVKIRTFALLTIFSLGLPPPGALEARAPESATGRREVPLARARTAMVVSSHPLATAAGVEILKSGGNAVDATVAVQAVLTLVEPQSSGIGGGVLMLYFDRATKKLHTYDGRETAPRKSGPGLFLHENGRPYGMAEAMIGGRSVGVPGALRALELAHRRHGKLPWRTLFDPAIELCEEGFVVSPRLSKLAHFDPFLRGMAGTRRYFYERDGRVKSAGTVLKNPELARVFRLIAEGGADAFYRGPLAEDIVAAVKRAKRPSALETESGSTAPKTGMSDGIPLDKDIPNPGLLTKEDLASYQAKEREPVCRTYRIWRVCGFGPPSSGGIAVLQILAMLERFPLGRSIDVNAPEALHLLAEAERLAYADRDRYLADADFVEVPVSGLLDSAYLKERSSRIDPVRSMGQAEPGTPPQAARDREDGVSPETPSTSHFSIVDAERNVVSMTSSIEHAFGSHVMVRGFLLNNQLTDFSFNPGPKSKFVANSVAPGKRPRSSMSPMIVFDQAGEPLLALGSAGGSRIIGHVARATLAVLEWKLDPQRAVSLPHVLNRNGDTELENEGWQPEQLESLRKQLSALGHKIDISEQNSGLHAIVISGSELLGGVDPRREGLAAGW